jgi:hypothetical protein
VLARPARFDDGLSAPVYRYDSTGEGIDSFATATRESVVTFLLDAIEKDKRDGTSSVLAI